MEMVPMESGAGLAVLAMTLMMLGLQFVGVHPATAQILVLWGSMMFLGAGAAMFM